jgi:hypothetical protein
MRDLQRRIVDVRLSLQFHVLRQRADIEATIGPDDRRRLRGRLRATIGAAASDDMAGVGAAS